MTAAQYSQPVLGLIFLRVDLREKFEVRIEGYNVGSMQIEQLFLDLLNLSRTLNDEQKRHVREQLSEDELVVFDLLTRAGPSSRPRSATRSRRSPVSCSPSSRARCRWIGRTRPSRAAASGDTIDEALDEGLPKDVFKAKSATIFQHVYEHYSGASPV